jgi:hypothetical protein
MKAGRFLAINRNLTAHRIIPGRDQHTNVYDERRFEIFAALKDVEKLFEENQVFRDKFFHLFLFFKIGLLRWAYSSMRQDLRGIFREYLANSYESFTDEDFHKIYKVMPDLALMTHRLKYAPATLIA